MDNLQTTFNTDSLDMLLDDAIIENAEEVESNENENKQTRKGK